MTSLNKKQVRSHRAPSTTINSKGNRGRYPVFSREQDERKIPADRRLYLSWSGRVRAALCRDNSVWTGPVNKWRLPGCGTWIGRSSGRKRLTFTNAASCPVVQGREIPSLLGVKVSTRGTKVEKEKKDCAVLRFQRLSGLTLTETQGWVGEAKMEALRASARGDPSTKYDGNWWRFAKGGERRAGEERDRERE